VTFSCQFLSNENIENGKFVDLYVYVDPWTSDPFLLLAETRIIR
jgi:hypothetical protein